MPLATHMALRHWTRAAPGTIPDVRSCHPWQRRRSNKLPPIRRAFSKSTSSVRISMIDRHMDPGRPTRGYRWTGRACLIDNHSVPPKSISPKSPMVFGYQESMRATRRPHPKAQVSYTDWSWEGRWVGSACARASVRIEENQTQRRAKFCRKQRRLRELSLG
jgi:hypothetical protein